MKRTSVSLGIGEGHADVHADGTAREHADKIIERGFATNFSEAVRVSLAWCALAIDAYDGLTAQRARLGPRRHAGAGAAPPRTEAPRG